MPVFEERRRRFLVPVLHELSPIQIIALGFLAIILVGTLLLTLPVSQRPGLPVSLLDCLFTATSATCVTGLVTVSTGDTWTRFGQTVILLMIQIGGLGYMTTATLIAILLGVRIGFRARLHLLELHGALSRIGTVRLVLVVALGTLLIELVGAALLATRLHLAHGHATGRALFEGLFYSISAFCNAGFDLAPGFAGLSLPGFRTDLWLLFLIGMLIVMGGLGFGVLLELIFRAEHRRLSLHTKIVLGMTIILTLLATIGFIFNEARNPLTLAGLDTPWQRVVTSWFMAVTARTAGFSPVDLSLVSPSTLSMLEIFMTIGGAPFSTAGGIKVTTAAILVLACLAFVRLRPDVEAFQRRIDGERVRAALALLVLYLGVTLALTAGITLVEIIIHGVPTTTAQTVHYHRLVFEVFSAMGTVGLSAGLTPQLDPLSRVLLIIGMYVGRLGPLAFAFVFTARRRPSYRRFPTETVMTG